MIRLSTSVVVARSAEDVFDVVADPRRFPEWNSAVVSVNSPSASMGHIGARYVMHRRLPGMHAVNDLEIVAHERPREFTIRTTSGPTPFVYRYRVEATGAATTLTLDAEIDPSSLPVLARPVAGRLIKRGIDENFSTLKHLLED
jgi:uncharacterized protein YndB with AHSA1/START domain